MARNAHSFRDNTNNPGVDYASVRLDYGTAGLTVDTPEGYFTINVEPGRVSILGPLNFTKKATKGISVGRDAYHTHIGSSLVIFHTSGE